MPPGRNAVYTSSIKKISSKTQVFFTAPMTLMETPPRQGDIL